MVLSWVESLYSSRSCKAHSRGICPILKPRAIFARFFDSNRNNPERLLLFHHFLIMEQSQLEKAARLHAIASEFRTYASQTEWPAYRTRMSEMADDLDREAAKLDRYRGFSIAS